MNKFLATMGDSVDGITNFPAARLGHFDKGP